MKIGCVSCCVFLLVGMLGIFTPLRATASYAGDFPIATYAHDKLHGGVTFTLGNSRYEGNLVHNDSYTVDFNVELPVDAKVEFARLYGYWCWSKNNTIGVLPRLDTTFTVETDGIEAHYSIEHNTAYSDRKGFVGWYDYLSGVYIYDVASYVLRSGNYSVFIRNIGPDITFCMYGFGLAIVYEDNDSPLIEYWVNEGADMLYAGYGITPEEATTRIPFNGDINLDYARKATLMTVVPSGGYCPRGVWEDIYVGRTSLDFNSGGWISELPPMIKEAAKLFFQYREGRVWHDVYVANKTVQIGIDERDVTNYLKENNNLAKVQDAGDYMMVTNGILVVEYSSTPVENIILDSILRIGAAILFVTTTVWLVLTRGRPRIKVSIPRAISAGDCVDIIVRVRSREKIDGKIGFDCEGIDILGGSICLERFRGKKGFIRSFKGSRPGKYNMKLLLQYRRKRGKFRSVSRKFRIEIVNKNKRLDN